MNPLKITAMMAAMIPAMAANAAPADAADAQPVIDKVEYRSPNGIFDIDALEALGRVSDPQLSPDRKTVLFTVSYESLEQNKSNADLYVMDADGANQRRLTRTAKSEHSAAWLPDGRIACIVAGEGDAGMQLVLVDPATGAQTVVGGDNVKGLAGFKFSPDGKKVVLIGSVKYARKADELYPDLPQATGRVIDDLMYKHWDEWVTEIPHPFVADFDGSALSNMRDIMQDEPFESPMKPFGGVESFAWSPDSKKLIYVSRKKTGLEYAISTNSDLFLYDLATGTTENLTPEMMGYDTCPVYSPNGKYVAWLSMERDGYESDKNRIFLFELATGKKTDLTVDWDYTADEIAWSPDSKSIFFIAAYQGCAPIFRVDIKSKKVTTVASGICDYTTLQPIDNYNLITMSHSMLRPNEIYRVRDGRTAEQITDINGDIYNQLKLPEVQSRMVPTTDGKEMLTWVVLPPEFDANKKYPAILYCQGGPQQAVSQFWSYRWNFMLMASQGYVMICPNRRGLPGFGTEWEEQISKDYPGQNMRDYLSAVDDMKKEPYIDADHIGCTGASYGGFSTYWLAGNHEGRFAAFLAHAGIFNMEAQYLETEEMWFANWDMGGAPWEKDNAAAQRTFAMSPHKFIDRWDTPIMVSHGEFDYRILSSQGEMAFNAAKLRGIPAEMVIFPDENHWILKPQNAVLWQRLFFRWFDKWLKPQAR